MASISLQEQMGAMAIIDELRHAKMEVQKHLDLPARRQAVAERIRNHYAAKGMSIDDALVEEGVKQFFASRLTYEAPQPGRIERALAFLFITRKTWGIPAALAVTLAISGVIGVNYAAARYTAHQLASFQGEVDEAVQARAFALKTLQALAERSATIGKAKPETAPARLLAANVQQEARSLVTTTEAIAIPAEVTKETLAAGLADLDLAEQQIKNVTRAVQRGSDLLTEAEGYLAANQRLAGLTSAPDFPQAVSAQRVKKAHDLANQAMATDSQTSAGHAAAAVNDLAKAIALFRSIQPMKGELQQLQQAVTAMKMSASDNEQFAPLFSRASAAIEVLDASVAEAAIHDAAALKDFAAQRLDLHVVSRAGQKSMIERNYDATGGKTWYLLTEATDAGGNVVSVPVVSSESGRKKLAKVFGVRVSEAQYRAAYADKKADGHVDDADMGFKAPNTLALTFERAVIGKPDIITEW